MSSAYDIGMDTFRASLDKAEADATGKVWRVSGRATKATPNKEDGAWWRAEGAKMVHAYYAWRVNNQNLQVWKTPEGVPAIELNVNVEIGNDTRVKGSIDRVFTDLNTGVNLIVDLKTGKEPKSGLQLAVYRLALQKQFGEAPDYGAYWLGREGQLGTVFDLRQYHEDMVARWMRDVQKAINLGVFVPNVGILCDYCGVKSACYAFGNTQHQPDFNDDLKESK